jgi:hypothetical protein
VQITHHAKGRFVRDADVADLPGALELGQRFQRIQQGDDRRGVGPGIAQLAKAVGWALRPVNLVEVEIIGLQALQAGVQRSRIFLRSRRGWAECCCRYCARGR